MRQVRRSTGSAAAVSRAAAAFLALDAVAFAQGASSVESAEPTPGFYGFFWFFLAAWFVFAAALVAAGLRRRPRTRVGRLARGLCVSGLGLFTLFVGAEGYLYFFHDTTDRTAVLLTSRRWTERHVTLNSAGFRDSPPPPAAREPGELRVLALGDSFTYGHGVADPKRRYTNLLEGRWAQLGVRARVLNAAKPGWSSAAELKMLRSVHPKAPLDLVILGYVLNDIDDLFEYPPDFWAAIESVRNPSPYLAPFVRHSLALDFLHARWTLFRHADFGGYDELMKQHYDDASVWARHVETLRAIVTTCAKRGVPLLVVTFPFLTRSWDDYRLGDVHMRLDALWTELGVAHVDLLDTYRATPAARLALGSYDSHPGELAHAIAAERIFEAAQAVLGAK